MNKYIIYYAIVMSLLAGKVVSTIYQGSMIVNHGSKISQLQAQKHELKAREQQLTNQLAQNYSLSSVLASSEMSEYTTISNPIVIHTSTTVASMQ